MDLTESNTMQQVDLEHISLKHLNDLERSVQDLLATMRKAKLRDAPYRSLSDCWNNNLAKPGVNVLMKPIQTIENTDLCISWICLVLHVQRRSTRQGNLRENAMKARIRSEQIDSILNSKGPDDEIMTELETYIADLEAKQPDRPTRITSLLQKLESRCSAESKASLEAYITQLEANQLVAAPSNNVPSSRFNPENPPRWSHHRSVEREQRRRVRALRKQNNYR